MKMEGDRHPSSAWSLQLHPETGVQSRVGVGLDPVYGGTGMPEREESSENMRLLRAFAPLCRTALGVASGVVVGGLLFLTTLVLSIRGGFPQPNLGLLSQFFWGYSVSLGGAFVGLFWGFVLGFILGWGFALVRNVATWIWLTVIRSRAEMEQYSDFLDHL
jgi:hypothetical protein